MRTSLRPRTAAGLLAIPALLIMLAGCVTPAASETPESSESGSVTSEEDFSAARDAYDLKLAECLRGKGFDIADPKPGQGITETDPGIPEAASACIEEIGDPPTAGTPPSEAEMLETGLKEVKCFRDRGFEVEEPSLGHQYTLPEGSTQEDYDACLEP